MLVIVTLLAPYYLVEQSLLGGFSLRIVAPIWSLVSYSGSPFALELALGTTIDYAPLWGLGIVMAILVFYTADRREVSWRGYLVMVFILLLMQIAYHLIIVFLAAGGPPTTFTFLPIAAIIAFALTSLIDREQVASWESS